VARVLLTGSAGGVGRAAGPVLEAAGWAVESFDLADGQDLRDEKAVLRAMRGCAAVIHAGALAHDSAGPPADVVATNLLGTWHVLLAAEACAATRVVYLSSGQVFGFAEGEGGGTPDYLPVDDATRGAPRGRTGCPSAWPRTCARRGPRGPASRRSFCGPF
jgi:nucleoside-diphosphate-sugar epimerase